MLVFKVSQIRRVLAGSITSACSWGRIFIILASGGTGSAPGPSGALTASAKFDPMSQFNLVSFRQINDFIYGILMVAE